MTLDDWANLAVVFGMILWLSVLAVQLEIAIPKPLARAWDRVADVIGSPITRGCARLVRMVRH